MSYSAKDYERLICVRDVYKGFISDYQDRIDKLSEDIVRMRLEIDCIEHCLEEFGHVCAIDED